ncbi:MAG: hypothetical protein ACLURP_03590 [Ruminococcus sp.]
MKKHKCTSICITVVAVLLLACGTALAAWNVSEYAVNLLSMSSYKNSIQENYVRARSCGSGTESGERGKYKK